ncbi:MAG: LysR family transcriptional regulator [Clostridiaceae bacterium]|jgi:DNA-binding transcriptional LysR family regulator|nr:LysR family transcriptional regulator [Clostridiaceae bacterium]
MDTNILKYMAFIKTVETGSFTKAAAALNYSQSGISRMINDLEKEWGIALMERSRAGVHLTSDGMQLLPYAKNLCAAYNKLQMQVDELSDLQAGLIRIAALTSVATHWLPNIIKEFQKDYPNIDYELFLGDYSEIGEWVSDGSVDCGFTRLPTLPDLETIFLDQDKNLAILPEGHPLTELNKVPVAALCDYPFLLLEKGPKAEITEIFESYGLTPKIFFTTWDDYAIMSMVESGLGISVLPQLVLKRVPYRIVIKELDVPASRDIGLVLKDKKTASLAVKRFLDYLHYR